MQELIRLLDAADAAQAAGQQAAVATVVRVKGSAYRREGTKMLIDAAGNQVCMISGGCLEQEVGEVAQRVMATGKSVVKFFDLDEDLVWGLGLGCGGSVDVYIEPFDTGEANARWLQALRAGQAAALATVIEAGDPSLQGKRMFIDSSGTPFGSLGDSGVDSRFVTLAQEKMVQLYPRSETLELELPGGRADIFLDVNVPPPELVIFGAGHDAIPVASYAHELGFRVTLVDARHAFVTEERFPHATLVRTHPSGFAEKVEVGPRSSVVVMNHHLERDQESLAFALTTAAPYIGVLGPNSRFERMRDALDGEGRGLTEADLNRVRNPVGLDIGADSPAEIAISIMTELLALRGGYAGGFLNDRRGPIHTDRPLREPVT
ncbi:XdhC family protein [soil metagenome]